MTLLGFDEADRSVVLALLQVAFLAKCDDQGLDPRGWPFSCLPDVAGDCLNLFFQSYFCLIGPFRYTSLYESLLQPRYHPLSLTGLKAPTN